MALLPFFIFHVFIYLSSLFFFGAEKDDGMYKKQ